MFVFVFVLLLEFLLLLRRRVGPFAGAAAPCCALRASCSNGFPYHFHATATAAAFTAVRRTRDAYQGRVARGVSMGCPSRAAFFGELH